VAEIDFLSLVENELLTGQIVSISVLQDTYANILSANNVKIPPCSRKKLKQIIQREIPQVEFHKPKRRCEPERVSIKCTRDSAMQFVEENDTDVNSGMKALHSAALVLREAISKSKAWRFSGSLTDSIEGHLPRELYSFFRWLLQGPNTTLSTDAKSSAVNKNAISQAQTTVTMFVSKSTVRRKETCTMRTSREMPNQVAIGLAFRQATRSKKVINMLYGFGVSGSLELRPTELKTIGCTIDVAILDFLISWRWLMDT